MSCTIKQHATRLGNFNWMIVAPQYVMRGVPSAATRAYPEASAVGAAEGVDPGEPA